jgi:hypothetical protein
MIVFISTYCFLSSKPDVQIPARRHHLKKGFMSIAERSDCYAQCQSVNAQTLPVVFS